VGGHRSDHRDAQTARKALQVQGDAGPLRLVQDVHRQDDRQARLDQLQGEREHPVQVPGVDDVEDQFGVFGEQDVAGDPLLLRDGEEAVHAGGVHHLKFHPVDAGLAAGDLHGRSGIVGNGHVGAGQIVEDHALAYIWVADDDYLRQPVQRLGQPGAGSAAVAGCLGGRGFGAVEDRHGAPPEQRSVKVYCVRIVISTTVVRTVLKSSIPPGGKAVKEGKNRGSSGNPVT
jgi:hypothetical protein